MFSTSGKAEAILVGKAAVEEGPGDGSRKGRLLTVTKEQRRHVLAMKGEKIARIARAVDLSKPTINRLLEPAEAN